MYIYIYAVYIYIYIYIYIIYTYRSLHTIRVSGKSWPPVVHGVLCFGFRTVRSRSRSLDVAGFDSGRFSSSRGGVPRPVRICLFKDRLRGS